MSTLHVRHIETALDKQFDGLVDIADVATLDPDAQRATFLTRSLAAFPVVAFTGASPQEIALGITDGTDDNGIDLVHYDLTQERLFLIQSKWRANGNGSPAVAEVQKFLQGIRDLTNLQFDRFNSKLRALQREITAALDNPRIRIEALFVHTGAQEQTEQVDNLFGDLLTVMNDAGDILSLRIIRQADIHALVSGEVEGAGIDLEVALFDWGQLTDPYAAFYGQVAASDIAAWYRTHGPALFARNLRRFITDSDVNHTISQSVTSAPETFWYLNNGITVLCHSIQKKAIGGTDRKHGQFACEGVSIVNGAQTVGSIGAALPGSDSDHQGATDARVLLRLISLENCPPEFATAVTRATNTQNRIVSRDFVALDEEQERLRVELRIEGKIYALKTGESDPPPEEGCSVVEATVALGCADPDAHIAVQVKREIGRIWEDTQGEMYKRIFNTSTTSTKVWRAVSVMRVVDGELRQLQEFEQGRRRQVAVHGNRLILHSVMRGLAVGRVLEGQHEPMPQAIIEMTDKVFELVCTKVELHYEGNYLASLFKNQTKCSDVANYVSSQLSSDD